MFLVSLIRSFCLMLSVTKGSSISEDVPVPMSDDKKKKAEALKRLSERKKKQDVQRSGRQKRRGGIDEDYEEEFDDDYEEMQEQVELEDEEEEVGRTLEHSTTITLPLTSSHFFFQNFTGRIRRS